MLNRKSWCNFASLSLLSFSLINLLATQAFAALPLQVGFYYGGGSRYIQIARQENRICYKGMSANGVTIASVTPHPQKQNFYKIYGMQDLVLSQSDPNTLLFGQLDGLSAYKVDNSFSAEIDPELQQCLNSQEPFRKQISNQRGRR